MPGTSVFEQGQPPADARYSIKSHRKDLVFKLTSVDTEGALTTVTFSGRPNGLPAPFAGGDLADQLAITLDDDRQITLAARKSGKELMTTKLSLSDSLTQMTVSQTVVLGPAEAPTNWSTYQRISEV
jgi:hypothetical protein